MITRLDEDVFEEVTDFWGVLNASEPMRKKALVSRMTDTDVVRRRLSHLPPSLRDVLNAAVKSVEWDRPFRMSEIDESGLAVEAHELDAAGLALSRRGFFCSQRGATNGVHHRAYCVPEELGAILAALFEHKSAPPEASIGLRAHLRWLDAGTLTRRLDALGLVEFENQNNRAIVRELARSDSFARRVESIEDPVLRELVPELVEIGGFLDVDGRRRFDVDHDRPRLRQWGRMLEDALIGSFAELNLTNHGVAVREGWLLVFPELVEARIISNRPDQDEAEEDLERTPDILADLRAIALEIEEAPFRTRKTGAFYRSAVKKLAKTSMSPGHRPNGAEVDLESCLGFLIDRELVSARSDGRLVVGNSWRQWESRDPVERVQDLLEFVVESLSGTFSPIHEKALKQEVLKELTDLGIGRWVSLMEPIIHARTRYMRRILRDDHAKRYQERHKNAPFPRLATPALMRQMMRNWVVTDLARLGLVELAVRSDDPYPWALRLTPLGGAALGLEVDLAAGHDDGLIVNPDHEVIVVPEAAGIDLVQQVGRFAVRLKADYAIHYALTKESVQAAAAIGMTSDEILGVLDSNSRHTVPQNVEYSIREWCRRVVALDARRSYVVEAPDKQTIDRMLDVPELSAIVSKRLSATVLELSADPTRAGIVAALRDRGFYL